MDYKGLFIRLNEAGDALEVLDQTRLATHEVWLSLTTWEEMQDALKRRAVRGTSALGIFSAYALYVLTVRRNAPDYKAFLLSFKEHCAAILSELPLPFVKDVILRCVLAVKGANPQTVRVSADAIRLTAQAVQQENAQHFRALGEHALPLLSPGDNFVTFSAEGALASSRYGALAPILLAQENGLHPHVFCAETRPRMTGARITAFELRRAGVKYTLVPDTALFSVLNEKGVKAVLLGCEQIARNGDVLAESGAAALAVLAQRAGVNVYVCAPTCHIDREAADARAFARHAGPAQEVTTCFFSVPVTPAGADVYNPETEVIDRTLITAILTEEGITNFPFDFSE